MQALFLKNRFEGSNCVFEGVGESVVDGMRILFIHGPFSTPLATKAVSSSSSRAAHCAGVSPNVTTVKYYNVHFQDGVDILNDRPEVPKYHDHEILV